MSYENIRNHYERLVIDEIRRIETRDELKTDPEILEDIACVALNHLPSRYVKHSVDLIYYLTLDEKNEMAAKVEDAVSQGYELTRKNTDDKNPT